MSRFKQTAASMCLLGAMYTQGCAAVDGTPSDNSASAPDATAPSTVSMMPATANAPPPPPPATSAGARPQLCDRTDRSDLVRDVFCTSQTRIESLAELRELLDFPADGLDPAIFVPQATLLAHSTALSGHVVSELNPRAFLARKGMFMAFSRGVQQVEIAAADQTGQWLNFYLLHFTQACNATANGCTPGDLYTPRIEADWLDLDLKDDEDLKNTASDCRQCHQRGRDKPILLMRELRGPWTHWFTEDLDDPPGLPEPSESALLRDYLRAKGDESYATLPTSILRSTTAFLLEGLVDKPQPVLFDGQLILNERWPSQDGTYAATPQPSTTWYAAFEAFKRGEQLPLPFYAPRATDPAKLARLTEAYQAYLRGEVEAEALPDFADIFPDDPQLRAEIGLQTEPGATPAQLLIQACGPCHNDVLDQSISRARFSVALGRMPQQELDLAVMRLQAAPDALGVMPPPGRRQIPAEDLPGLIAYLQANQRPADDDATLERAAKLGMNEPDVTPRGLNDR